MGNDIGMYRLSIGMFYIRAYSCLVTKLRVFFGFGILKFMKVMLYLQNLICMFVQTCHFTFSTNIQFNLILLLLLILDNDIHQNPGPKEYELSVFHLNARSVRNKLSYLEDIASEPSIICVTESHLDEIYWILTLVLMVLPIQYLEKIETVLGVGFSCILLRVFM